MNIEKQLQELAQELKLTDYKFPDLFVKAGAIHNIADYLAQNGWKKVSIVYDKNTFEAAGKHVQQVLKEAGFLTHGHLLPADEHNQVIANEEALVQLLVDVPKTDDVLIAVGSGTIHDIVRFASYHLQIPFISFPTAASVDGFTSKGAPIIVRKVKKTVQTVSPIAVFADLHILQAAPKEMTAAGFGDILGKYTSLLDWKISGLIGNEPYNETAANLTKQALELCVNHVEKIQKADQEGIKILMEALLLSGLVMQLLNHSRPASGAEHHLSHYWEMHLLKTNQKQLLHGAKVGVATTIISDLYKQKKLELEKLLDKDTKYQDAIRSHLDEIQKLIDDLPSSNQLRSLLKKIEGPSTIEELGIAQELVKQSLNEAYHLRDRCTGLLLINQIKESELPYPFS